ncbi:Cys-tRNA(Pro) deacylase [Saccharibacillus sp. CPCC 101409]|uniref:Cys-tRNA(Pro) deacylase n=1 Tax=Saccharibacillus sp. CPCC 101409 TaxID=3058041 RepID=UPI0026720876|nr:Cys-tRNA(Pro) deacylase [Saccharibacillus sp. CPCC 101409]MDO3408888.1 Cys-tRNA(Pro) deacylase [Saccharibacillus sp. CPCC 101409]
MAAAKISKTNAMRMLDELGIGYDILSYDNEDGQIHGTAVAEKTGQAAETVFKTLVAHAGANGYVFVIPVAGELDLKKAARAAGEKKIEMLPLKDLQKWTGYVRGGCSPIGMKKHFPTFADVSGEGLEQIVVSAGKVGLQVKLPPSGLVSAARAEFAELTKDE